MDTEGAFDNDFRSDELIQVKSKEAWDNINRVAEEKAMILLVEFRQEFCRKCMAMAPRFRKLPVLMSGRNVLFVEVDAMKLGKEVRKELGVKVVPTFHLIHHGEVLDQLVAGKDLTQTILQVVEMVNRYAPSEDSEDNKGVINRLKSELEGSPAVPRIRPKAARLDADTKTVNEDAFTKWKQAQARRAQINTQSPAFQVPQGEKKSEATPQRADEGKPRSTGGMSPKELLAQLEKAKQKKAESKAAPGPGGAGAEAKGPPKVGGNSKEELLAQLKALEEKRSNQ
eukprot:CAMPEP_0181308326 /NCGR_PEP_ID=MMETSP1101-20121128/11402_1 /TAXON_ID=46948 /ORGANISM="Rhodomonas abbreviata, Strain Caron Lab Isolate" /LENGTH=283 /DNA_ID=CAMNT_0023414699 /DNA_START=295 /DNA_END=1146 /DNA_ORIENTATION=+